jgi:hypothetical protein
MPNSPSCRPWLARVVVAVLLSSAGTLVACSPSWKFRLRDRAGVVDDKPRSVTLRCDEAPLYLTVRADGNVSSWGPLKLECEPEKAGLCTPKPQRMLDVKKGARLRIDAQLPERGNWGNGGICLHSPDTECRDDRSVLDVFVECQASNRFYERSGTALRHVGPLLKAECQNTTCQAVLYAATQMIVKGIVGVSGAKQGDELKAGSELVLKPSSSVEAGKPVVSHICFTEECLPPAGMLTIVWKKSQ